MLIKKLRVKFVAITMFLVTAVFTVMSVMDYQFTKYLEEQEHINFDEDYDNYKMALDIAVTVGSFGVMLLVVIFLSRFVTEPAKKALEREKQFISDASHELKTPLAAININAQALKTEIGDDKHLEHIISETKRMDSLLKKLLKLSYTEEKGAAIDKKDFSLSKATEEIVLTMESVFFEKKIKFEYEIAGDVFCFGNEDDIKQVIAILLDNALKHTAEKGSIFFKLEKPAASGKPAKSKKAVITVENTGEGISEEDLPHIFERFYKTDKARISDSNSYGLGLAIAKAILDFHGAKIGVLNVPGGVKFWVEM